MGPGAKLEFVLAMRGEELGMFPSANLEPGWPAQSAGGWPRLFFKGFDMASKEKRTPLLSLPEFMDFILFREGRYSR